MRYSQAKWGCHTLRFSQDAASTVRQHKASADMPKGPYGEAPDGASLGVVVDAGVGVAVGADFCAGVVDAVNADVGAVVRAGVGVGIDAGVCVCANAGVGIGVDVGADASVGGEVPAFEEPLDLDASLLRPLRPSFILQRGSGGHALL